MSVGALAVAHALGPVACVDHSAGGRGGVHQPVALVKGVARPLVRTSLAGGVAVGVVRVQRAGAAFVFSDQAVIGVHRVVCADSGLDLGQAIADRVVGVGGHSLGLARAANGLGGQPLDAVVG